MEDIDVDDYESILYSLVEDVKICSSLFFVMDDSKDKDVSLQKIKVFFEDDTSIPDNYKDRIRTNKYRYIIDDITKMVSVKKSYTELNIDMNYLNLVKELVFEEFKKEYFLIKQNTDKSSEMFARDVVIVFNLDSESLLDEMKSYLSRFIDLISDCDVEVGKDPIRLFQIGAYEYELILDDLTFLNQVVGWENKTTKKFKEFINKMKNESDENHVFEKIIENYSMRGLIFKLSKDI